MQSANEQMALLLGWEHRESDGWWQRITDGACAGPPDYTQWDRFPEMQEYVKQHEQFVEIHDRILDTIDEHFELAWAYITPTILRDAIVEVCGAQ